MHSELKFFTDYQEFSFKTCSSRILATYFAGKLLLDVEAPSGHNIYRVALCEMLCTIVYLHVKGYFLSHSLPLCVLIRSHIFTNALPSRDSEGFSPLNSFLEMLFASILIKTYAIKIKYYHNNNKLTTLIKIRC